jgi:alkanesulfonate monooxygenase SsuD/methylene tetrahydromethanopterin reductase-like flavin-dependent oxidoreductase (luciferase family)
MVGGSGEKRTLRLVAQYADACNISGDAPTVRRKLEALGRYCADVGRDRAEISVTRLGSLFLTSGREQTSQVREFVEAAVGPEEMGAMTIGTADQVVDQVGTFVESGVEEFLFNMPLAEPEGITEAGKVLTSAFA